MSIFFFARNFYFPACMSLNIIYIIVIPVQNQTGAPDMPGSRIGYGMSVRVPTGANRSVCFRNMTINVIIADEN